MKIQVQRKRQLLAKWIEYYIVLGIPKSDLIAHTGAGSANLGFSEGLLKDSPSIFSLGNGKTSSLDVDERLFDPECSIYIVHFTSEGLVCSNELFIKAGESDQEFKVLTRFGRSNNKLVLSRQ
jgi:hypothetical protein